MQLRAFKPADTPVLLELFRDTVQHVNKKHYTSEQIEAWTSGDGNLKSWTHRQSANITIVAEAKNVIVGFGEMNKAGNIEMLYVHKNYLQKGIASSIVGFMEEQATKLELPVLTTEASITARPFFEKLGFKLENAEHKIRNEVVFIQFRMLKQLL